MQICPACGKMMRKSTVSRRDRAVRLCQICAYKEGLIVAGIDQQEADRIVSNVQLAGGFVK